MSGWGYPEGELPSWEDLLRHRSSELPRGRGAVRLVPSPRHTRSGPAAVSPPVGQPGGRPGGRHAGPVGAAMPWSQAIAWSTLLGLGALAVAARADGLLPWNR